ncbi:MAG: methyltransferase domain-containing protein [Candidatus Cyclobacteriaceae bacterium M2_1C_046]
MQFIFSHLPRGEKINYLFQKHITKKLPPNKTYFLNKVSTAEKHFLNFKEYNKITKKKNTYYEFGAGSTLIIPLCMSHYGFEITCIDLRRLIIPELIIDTLNKIKENKNLLPFEVLKTNTSVLNNSDILSFLRGNYNLSYEAPKDARSTDYQNESFDFISSTVTLEHIPSQDILQILNECYRILSKGGILSITIDYKDHWSYFDQSITIYNFLKYTVNHWTIYNPALHYQNRLRHSDYLEIIKKTDFQIVKEEVDHPTKEDLINLKSINISQNFKSYDFYDLAKKSSEIVLLKP